MSAEKSDASRVRRWLTVLTKIDRNDIALAAGMFLLARGLWMIYPPAALIVVGVGLIALAIIGARKE